MHHDSSGDRPGKGKSRQPTPSGAPSPLEAVRQLLAERTKFEKWLLDLEAKRASTPTHVFDRVKGDYSTRLEAVVDKLRTHASAMQEHAKALTQKLEQLTESEQGIEDTRAEQELRAQVGELSEPDWEKTSKKLEKELAKIKQDQALITSDLNDLRALLATFEAAPRPSAPVPVATDGKPASSEPAAPPSQGNVDELAFLKSVIGTTPPTPQPKAPAAPAPKAAEPPAAPKKPSLVEPPAAGPVIKPKGGEEALSMHVTGSNPIVLRTSGVVEQPKTLKCAECGSMNYPS